MPDEFLAFALFAMFGVPAGAWVAVRMMEHLERMEMIRRGMLPPLRPLDTAMGVSLGILLGTLSIVLLAGLWFVLLTDEILMPGFHAATNVSWWAVLPGLVLLALILCRRASRRSNLSRRLGDKTIRDAGASLMLPKRK